MKIPFSVWHDRNISSPARPSSFICAPFHKTPQKIHEVLETMVGDGPFTHVIASVERSVYPASIARRYFNARLSKHTVILRCHDKLHMKNFLKQHHIPMAQYTYEGDENFSEKCLAQLGFPLVVKNRTDAGGRGMRFVDTVSEAMEQINRNKVVEQYVDANEISVESFIQNGKILFTNITDYHVKKHVNIVPADLTPSLQKDILDLNQKVISALDIQWGMTHVEMYLHAKGLVFGEIAIRPPGGHIMELLQHSYDFNAWRAFICIELDQPFVFPKTATSASAAYMFAPPPGVIDKVEGIKALKTMPAMVRVHIKAKVGKAVSVRESVSSDVGHILCKAKNHQKLMENITYIKENVHIETTSPKPT